VSSSINVPNPLPLTQLLRSYTPEINAFAAWLMEWPSLHSLEFLSESDRCFIRARLEEDGAREFERWQAARYHPDMHVNQWTR